MIIFNKFVMIGVLLINVQAQGMLVPSVAKKYAAVIRHQQNGIQKRTGITHIPFEKRTQITSIADLEDHFKSEEREKTRCLFDTNKSFDSFVADRARDNKIMGKYYAASKKDGLLEPTCDPQVFPYFVEKLQAVSGQFGIHSGVDIISSWHLQNDSRIAYAVQKRLHGILKELHPAACDSMLRNCAEFFQGGALLVEFGGIVLHKNDESTFAAPILIVSHEMSELLKDRAEVPRCVDHIIYQYVGKLLCGHRNMLYHLTNAVSLEDKTEQFEKLKRLQETVQEITCSLQDAQVARENNLFYRREGFIVTSTLPERLHVVQQLLLSELIMNCHRNDGNIKE